MFIKYMVFRLFILMICVYCEIVGFERKVETNLKNCCKNRNTYYGNIFEGKETLEKKLKKEEEVCNNPTVLQNPFKHQFPCSKNLNTNSEYKKNFFVITAIFNPASYQSRHTLYENFARHMSDTGAQLVTIECIFPSLNQTEFRVTQADNPWHIQLKSKSVYWMKENLINIAVSKLPSHAKWICWLDADIEFENKNWLELTIQELKKYTIVQMFEKGHFLGPAPQNEILRTDYSFGYSVVHNKTISTTNYKNWFPHPGYGWAMSVDDFRKINGLPYFIITGSADHLFAYSLINAKNYPMGHYQAEMNTEYKEFLVDKLSLNFPKLKELGQLNQKEIVGYLPVTLRHYWHGSRVNRQYNERWKILADLKFNFYTDVIVNEDGLLQFASNKPGLQTHFLKFFASRNEDLNNTDITDSMVHVAYKKAFGQNA